MALYITLVSKNIVAGACIVFLSVSCQMSSRPDKRHAGNNENTNGATSESNTYKLHFNPAAGSSYYYTINNESDIELEVSGKEINNRTASNVGVAYDIQKDSAGNIVLNMRYDKIHLYSKNGDKETEMDAANAASTSDPVEKMLGVLKGASVSATINSKGEVAALKGYKELGDKIMANLNAPDLNSRNMAQSRVDQVIGEGLIKKNMDQLLNLFPDTTLRIGDTWTLSSKQPGEIAFKVTTTYTLKDIDDGIAIIESRGEMANDKGVANVMGQAVTGNLEGRQEGTAEIDIQTGMLLSNTIKAKVEGTLQIVGRDIPVTINNTVKMQGKRTK
jgi:hypothetical protein